jgi:hypothetical protein
VEEFPRHRRFARALDGIVEHLVRTAESQSLSSAERAEVSRLIDGASHFIRRVPGALLRDRSDEMRKRLASAA